MNNDIFARLCQELGYDADDVISIRVNEDEVVILTRQSSGDMCIVTHRPGHDGSHLVSRGVPFGPRPGRYGGGRARRTPATPDVMR